MRRLLPICAGALLLAGVAAGAYYARAQGPLPDLEPEALVVPAELARWIGPREERAEFGVSWWDGSAAPRPWNRIVRGVVELNGTPHLHILWAAPGRRERVVQEAYYRAQDGTWACARRQVGINTLDLDPPLPELALPLEVGQRWTWTGRVGSRPAEATFEVRPAKAEDHLVIAQTLRLEGGLECKVTRTYRAGHGLVHAEGDFPYEPADSHRSSRAQPTPTPSAPAGSPSASPGGKR